MEQRPVYIMKITALIGILCAIAAAVIEFYPTHSSVQWVPYEMAFQRAKVEHKLVYVDVYAEWCAPCKRMDRITFANDTVIAALTEGVIATRVNGDDPNLGAKMKNEFNVTAMPTSLLFRSENAELKRHVGFMDAAAFMDWIADTSLSEFVHWDEFNEARVKAQNTKKTLIILALHDSLKVMEMQRAFQNKNVKQIIKRNFVPVLLINTITDHQKVIAQYTLLPSFDFVGYLYTFTPSMELIRAIPLRNWDASRTQSLVESLSAPQ